MRGLLIAVVVSAAVGWPASLDAQQHPPPNATARCKEDLLDEHDRPRDVHWHKGVAEWIAPPTPSLDVRMARIP
jgi:hypothetical protein